MTIERNSGGVIFPYRGRHPQVHQNSFIAENAILVGDIKIGPGSSIWYSCVLRGDLNHIRIGDRYEPSGRDRRPMWTRVNFQPTSVIG